MSLPSGTRKRPPQSGFVQIAFTQVMYIIPSFPEGSAPRYGASQWRNSRPPPAAQKAPCCGIRKWLNPNAGEIAPAVARPVYLRTTPSATQPRHRNETGLLVTDLYNAHGNSPYSATTPSFAPSTGIAHTASARPGTVAIDYFCNWYDRFAVG
jgi:hypothetical protein